jgi:dienelactone hydrolase
VQADDYANSVEQVKNLRRALDVLAADPRIDPARLALVGHDFGGMYGTLAAATDPRIKALTIMAATTSFSDWYMYGKFRLDGEAKANYVAKMAPLDPVKYMAKLSIPVLMQFAQSDFYVPRESIAAFRKALPNSTKALIYDAGHGLDWQATRDRKAFLTADFREVFVGNPGGDLAERKNYFEFDKAANGHFEYRVVDLSDAAVTLDVYESNDLFEALGCGVRRERTIFRLRDGKIREMEVTSILDARKSCSEARNAFVAWAEKERPAEAGKFLAKGRLQMTGSAAAPMIALAKEWAKYVK